MNESNSIPISPPEILITRSIRFGLYVFSLPCSLLCTFYLLYHLLAKKTHRQGLHNHSLIFLLVSGLLFELIDLPLQMDYLNLGYIRIQSPSLCLIWMLIEFWCHSANSILLAWASIERHILVFHSQWMARHKYNKILFHYLPLIILFIYLWIYYLVAIIFPPCSTTFDYNSQLCGFFPCFMISLPSMALWDAIVHNTIPILLISLFNAALFIRVVRQKYRHHQPMQWRKYKKMAIQLLTISTWYLFINFPLMLNVCFALTGSNNAILMVIAPYLAYLSYYVILLMPFVCLISMWKDIKPRHRGRVVALTNGNNNVMNASHQRKHTRNIP
jgi:hypothetical protein